MLILNFINMEIFIGIVYGGNYKKKIPSSVSKTLYWLFNEKDYEHE